MMMYLKSVLIGIFFCNPFLMFAQQAAWTALHPDFFPTNTSGQINGISRVSQLKFHPTNPNKLYAISARGGLFLSANSGNTWVVAPGTDSMPYARLASVCIDHTNDQVLYLGTGDHNYYYSGSGVWKSTNGGNSFTQLGLYNRLVVDMLMDPLNHQHIVAVTDAGIFKTTNAGISWSIKTAARPFDDIKQKSATSRVLYAATADSAFFRSTDFGETWSQITTGIQLPAGISNGNGCRLAVSAADSNIVYLGMVANGGILYKSTNGGNSFSAVKTSASPYLTYYNNTPTSSTQGNYNFAIGVDNLNPNTIYMVSHCVWKSVNGGVSWTQLTNWWADVHTDMHQIVTSPFNNNLLYNANDGGIWVSTNGGINWTQKSDGLNGYEIYHGNCSPTRQDMMSIGTQDNGELYASGSTWYCNRGGDWTSQCSFDYRPNSSMVYYHGSNKRRLVTGSETTYGLPSRVVNLDDITFHRSNPDLAFVADSFIYRTTNLTASSPSWTQIAATGKKLMAIHSSFADPNRLYVIASDGTFYASTNALSATPVFTSSSIPNSANLGASITTIKQSPNTIYITANTNVYRSTNNGLTWVNITYNLPSVNHVRVLADEYYSSNELVFIASNNAVYYNVHASPTWTLYNTNLPKRTEVVDLSIYNDSTSATKLRYASYGRSVWETSIQNLRTVQANFVADNVHPCINQPVTFSDQSLGNIISRTWSFPGGNPSVSSAIHPVVSYNSIGSFPVTLTVSDGINSQTKTINTYIRTTGGALPLSEGFESLTDIPHEWQNIDNQTQGIKWAKTNAAGGYGLSGNAMLFDNYSWNHPGEKDELHVRRINLGGLTSCKLLFDIAYQVFSGYADSLAVFVSTDCGNSFTKVYQKGGMVLSTAGSGGNNFVPNAAQWRTDSINLNTYCGQPNVLIAFQNINGYGNKLYLDNINLQTTCLQADLPVVTASQMIVCSGEATTLHISSGNLNSASNWQWYADSCGVTSIGSGTSLTVHPQTSTTYTVRGEGNCVYASACESISIAVYPVPVVTAANVSGCEGDAIALNGSPAGGSYSLPNPYTGTSGMYTYQITDSNGCIYTSQPAMATVHANPIIGAMVNPNDSICYGDPILLSGQGATTYTWSGGGQAPTDSVSFIPQASAMYHVIGTDANGCTGSTSVNLVVFNNPPTVTGDSRCDPGIVTLTASGTGNIRWYDSLNGGNLLDTGTVFQPNITNTTTFYAENTDMIGVTGSLSTVGPLNNLIGPGLQSTLIQWMNFNVMQACVLESVVVYPGAAGQVILECRNSNGSVVLHSSSITVTTAQVGMAVTMPLNWNLSTGSGFRIYRGSASVPLYRNSAGTSFPYTNGLVSITGNSLGNAFYYWAYHWKINNYTTNYCNSMRVPVDAVVMPCHTNVQVKLFLQGYYDQSGWMVPAMMNQGIGGNAQVTDSITIELRHSFSPFAIASTCNTVLSTDGHASCLMQVPTGMYYIAITHRNTLTTWSATPIGLNGGTVQYDFSTHDSLAYGNTLVAVDPGIFALYSGDINQDENIDLVDLTLFEIDLANFLFGYEASDINGDGNIDLLDTPVLDANINNFIFAEHP